jgi:transcriptional regulator with XRE-family HTH domain
MSLRARREALGLTQAEVAERAGTTQAYYGQIESGRTRMPNAELRRSISAALGLRHVDFLIEVGELGDWELPGFSASQPVPDQLREDLIALIGQIDLQVDNRAGTLSGILRLFAEQDRQRNGVRPTAVQREAQ